MIWRDWSHKRKKSNSRGCQDLAKISLVGILDSNAIPALHKYGGLQWLRSYAVEFEFLKDLLLPDFIDYFLPF